MKLFDYLFYRIYSFYKRKRDSTPDWMGALVISLLVFFTILSVFSLLTIAFKFDFSKFDVNNNIKPLALLLMIIVFLPIRMRYRKEVFIQKIVSHYKNEEIGKKRLRGWLLVSYLILVFLIPISIGYMRHNLGMDI